MLKLLKLSFLQTETKHISTSAAATSSDKPSTATVDAAHTHACQPNTECAR